MHSTRLAVHYAHHGLTLLSDWQVILGWLDKITEELAASETRAIEAELQQTAETALKQQAEQSTIGKEALHWHSQPRRH